MLGIMKTWFHTRARTMMAALCERWHLVLENLALHHQVAVMQRSAKRPQFSHADRFFWIVLSTVWSRWQGALTIVQADTVRRWRRQGGCQLRGLRRERKRPGRPPIPGETQALIRRMSRENGPWGAPRIQSELALLGIGVSRTTVAKYMPRRAGPPSQTWRTFCRNHVPYLIAIAPAAERMHHVQVLFAQVVQTLRRWLTAMVESWTRQFFGHPARVSPLPHDITPVPRLRIQPVMDRIQALERSPPAPISSPQQDDSAKNQSLDLLTSEVRLPSSVIVRWDGCPLLRRPRRHNATAPGRGLLQRKAA